MFLKSLTAIGVGLCAGIGISAGTFAFLLVVRVIPRIIQKAKLEYKIISIENAVVLGVIFGTILSLFSWEKRWLFQIIGETVLILYGISAGIFVGCLAVALAEILDTFPIFFRRIHLKEGYSSMLILIMALGKMAGSFFFFLTGYDTIVP